MDGYCPYHDMVWLSKVTIHAKKVLDAHGWECMLHSVHLCFIEVHTVSDQLEHDIATQQILTKSVWW